VQITIRPASASDATAIHSRCFADRPDDLARAHLNFCLKHAHVECLVALADGEIAGFGELTIRRGVAEIGNLAVQPAYRRRGVGRLLLEALQERARRRGVETLEIGAGASTPWLVAFYRRLGFQPARKIRLPQAFGCE